MSGGDEGIDLVAYGALRAEVANLRRDVDAIAADVKRLVALAEQSRGMAWLGRSILAAAGVVVGWGVAKWLR